jgi:hypothetical protein
LPLRSLIFYAAVLIKLSDKQHIGAKADFWCFISIEGNSLRSENYAPSKSKAGIRKCQKSLKNCAAERGFSRDVKRDALLIHSACLALFENSLVGLT